MVKKALVKIANNFLSSILITSKKNEQKSIVSVFYLVYEPTYSFFARQALKVIYSDDF